MHKKQVVCTLFYVVYMLVILTLYLYEKEDT